ARLKSALGGFSSGNTNREYTVHKTRREQRSWFRSAGQGSVLGRRLMLGMERLEERHQCRSLRRIQILPICRHIAAPLENLPHQLIARQSDGDRIESRPSL